MFQQVNLLFLRRVWQRNRWAVNKQIEFDDELQETGIFPVEKDNIPKPLGDKGYIRVDEHFKYLGAYTAAQMVQPQKIWTIYNACVLATLLYKRIRKKQMLDALRCQRKILKVTWSQHIRNDYIRQT